MARYETTILVPAAPDEAFQYLADFTNTATWDPSVVEATRLDEGPFRAGSSFHVVVAFYGRRVPLTFTIETFEPERRLVLVGEGRRVRSRDTMTFVPQDGGTSITYAAELQLRGALRILDRGLQLAFSGMGDRAAAGLKQALGG
jgi:dehydrogenase/reductase SDR family member 12